MEKDNGELHDTFPDIDSFQEGAGGDVDESADQQAPVGLDLDQIQNVSGQYKDGNTITKRQPVTEIQYLQSDVKRVLQMDSHRQFEEDLDIVSKMASRNLHHLLSWIFLSLTSLDLTACRYVCINWHRYLKLVFWRDEVVRRQLLPRLSQRWQTKQYHQECLVISGQSCKKKCAQNCGDCCCIDKLQCQISGTQVVVEFGGSHLMLETGNWLNSPILMEKNMKRKHHGKIEFEVCPADPTYILVKNRRSKEIQQKFQPFTGSDWTRLSVDDLVVSSGRLAVLCGGKVFVYNISSLLEGANRNALLLTANDRPGDPEVNIIHLQENLLLTVGGFSVTTYDFWKLNCNSSISGTSKFD